MRLLVFNVCLLLFAVATSFTPGSFPDVVDHDRNGGRLPPSLTPRNAPFEHRMEMGPSAISKRTHSLQIHHMEIRSLVSPILHAAASLYAFYFSLYHECVSNWIHITPLYSLRITYGYFSFTMYSTGGPIPWALVAEVAGNMMMLTRMGFTGTYDIWYDNPGYGRSNAAALGDGGNQPGFASGHGVMVEFRIGYSMGRTGGVVIDASVDGGPFQT